MQKTSGKIVRWVAGWFCLVPALLQAHPGHYHPGEEDEFDAVTSGFLHPFTGMDHLILALAVGWLAFVWKGGKARVPVAAFLASLMAGAYAGRGLQAGMGLEIALALTLVAAGAAFIVGKSPGAGLFAAAVAVGGFVHGFAHGSEAMSQAPFVAYSIGFLMGTAVLLTIGAAICHLVSKRNQPVFSKLAGLGLILLGSVSLFQSI